MDRRTREARLLAEVRADLTAHVGGTPSATQRRLIERCAWLSLHVSMLDRKVAEGGAMSEHDHRSYLAWNNTLTRTLRHLGLKGTPAPKRSLAEHIAGTGAAA